MKKNAQITSFDVVPNNSVLASYVQSLRLFVVDNMNGDSLVIKTIKGLPDHHKVRDSFSRAECAVLFETVGWLWKKITGKNIIEEEKIEQAPRELCGNYWMIGNGVLLHGPNHFTIIKRQSNLFCAILGIGAMEVQKCLAQTPNELIGLAIRGGAMRMFITPERKAYFQLTDKTYGEWGRDKIKQLAFKEKNVKVIDANKPYNGWTSGISINL